MRGAIFLSVLASAVLCSEAQSANKNINQVLSLLFSDRNGPKESTTINTCKSTFFVSSTTTKTNDETTPSSRLVNTTSGDYYSTDQDYDGNSDSDNMAMSARSGKADSTIQVYVGLTVQQVMAVNEKEQSITLKLVATKQWQDCNLSWDQSVYSVSAVQLSGDDHSDNMFLPKQILLEQTGRLSATDSSQTTILSNGLVNWQDTFIAELSCNIDVEMYPFDTQICRLTLQSENSLAEVSVSELLLTNFSLASRLTTGTVWQFVVLPPVIDTVCICEFCELGDNEWNRYCTFDKLTYTVLLRRFPQYQFVNLMVPAFVITALASLVFLLPDSYADKLNPSLTILVSLFVFTQVTYQSMPETGATLPLLSRFYLVCIILVAFNCVLCVISSRYPTAALIALASSANCQEIADKLDESAQISDLPLTGESMKAVYTVENCPEHAKSLRVKNNLLGHFRCKFTRRWICMPQHLDRFFFFFYLAACVLNAAVFSLYGYANYASFDRLVQRWK